MVAHQTLKEFMEEWLSTDTDGATLNGCVCFPQIIAHYELEVAVRGSPIGILKSINIHMKMKVNGRLRSGSHVDFLFSGK